MFNKFGLLDSPTLKINQTNYMAPKKGFKHSMETKLKMSLAKKGKMPKNIDKIKGWNKGLTKYISKSMMRISEKNIENNRLGVCGNKGFKHTEETKDKMRKSNKTKFLWKNPKYREMMSVKHKEFYKKYPEKHPNRIVASNNRMTFIEKQIETVLLEIGLKNKIDFEHNYRILSYFPDFTIFNKKLIIECDGQYWHSSKEAKQRDKKRQLVIENLGYKFIRFTGVEIRNNLKKCKMMIYAELYGDIEK